MNTWELVLNIALFLCSGGAFICGVAKFFKKEVALFNRLITCGLGCMALERLFNSIEILLNGFVPPGFSVGTLGLIGGFLFLFSASFGQMDVLADDGENEYRKYRLISAAAPFAIIVSYVILFSHMTNLEDMIISGVVLSFFAQCSYFNLKHLIIPDVKMGIVQLFRGYNLVALILTALSTAEVIIDIVGGNIAATIIRTLLCASYLMVIPMLEKGVKKWAI